MCMTKNWDGIALFIVTLLLIGYGAYMANAVFIFFWHWAGSLDEQFIQGVPLTLRGLIYFWLFNGSVALTLCNFVRAAFTDPGRISEGMKAPFQSEFMKMEDCNQCVGRSTWKPQRAHHCEECGHCVFKMDQHCQWINNCIGHRNYKYYFQFVIYIMLSAGMLALFMFMTFVNLLNADDTR